MTYGTLVTPHPALWLGSALRLTPGSPVLQWPVVSSVERTACFLWLLSTQIPTLQHQEDRDSSFQEQFQYFQRSQLL